jgi:hypothetical protein
MSPAVIVRSKYHRTSRCHPAYATANPSSLNMVGVGFAIQTAEVKIIEPKKSVLHVALAFGRVARTKLDVSNDSVLVARLKWEFRCKGCVMRLNRLFLHVQNVDTESRCDGEEFPVLAEFRG